jgi:hypothetical protein
MRLGIESMKALRLIALAAFFQLSTAFGEESTNFDGSPFTSFSYEGQRLIEPRITSVDAEGVSLTDKEGRISITVPLDRARKQPELRMRARDAMEEVAKHHGNNTSATAALQSVLPSSGRAVSANLERVLSDAKAHLKRRPTAMKISFKKIRGSEEGEATSDKEEWACKITFRSLPSNCDFRADLNFYDGGGVLLHKERVIIMGAFTCQKTGPSASNRFYLPLSAIENIACVKLEGDGLVNQNTCR